MILLVRAQASHSTMTWNVLPKQNTRYISKLYKYEDWTNKSVKMLLRGNSHIGPRNLHQLIPCLTTLCTVHQNSSNMSIRSAKPV